MRLPFPLLRTSALAGALVMTLVATGVDPVTSEPVWLSGAQTASGYTGAGAGEGLAAAPVGTAIEAAAGAGHALGWQTAGGKGSTSRLYRSAVGASFAFSGTPEALTVSATDVSSTAQVTFTAPSGRALEPGTYATGDGSALAWSGRGSCPAAETHSFTITSLTWASDGVTLTGLDATFTGSCGTSAKGRILINAVGSPAPATATATVTAAWYAKSRVGRKTATKLLILGQVACAGAARVTLTGHLVTKSSPVVFSTTVDCTPGATVSWSVTLSPRPLIAPGMTDYWVSGSVFDTYYRYTGDILTKDKQVAVQTSTTLPRRSR
ncbi:hypothetical protein AB0H43_00415 [Hamadaea sp. NPDC050747]|uniref:hypothetical protein n=1 Tax=Hamadaea sp. NPDC050747 TaxID=3155789 RepID=UPI0033C1C940